MWLCKWDEEYVCGQGKTIIEGISKPLFRYIAVPIEHSERQVYRLIRKDHSKYSIDVSKRVSNYL